MCLQVTNTDPRYYVMVQPPTPVTWFLSSISLKGVVFCALNKATIPFPLTSEQQCYHLSLSDLCEGEEGEVTE